VLLALVFSLSFLSGHVPHFAWVLFLTGAWAYATGGVPALRKVAAGAALAGGYCLAQGLSTAARCSIPSGRRRFFPGGVFRRSPEPERAVGFFPSVGQRDEGPGLPGEKFFWLGSFHLGVVGGIGFLCALGRLSRRACLLWAGVFALGLVMALGTATPLFGFLPPARVLFAVDPLPDSSHFGRGGGAPGPIADSAAFSRRAGAVVCLLIVSELFSTGGAFSGVAVPLFSRARRLGRRLAGRGPGEKLFLTPRAAAATQGGGPRRGRWCDLRGRLLC